MAEPGRAGASEAAYDPNPPRHPDGGPARLLVVDDEDVLADLLTEVLGLSGYQVTVARSGAEVFAAVAESEPDLIVLDVNLPDLDGFTVATRLRAAGHQIPIVFLTARISVEDLRAGFATGGDDYLTKPFRVEELFMRVSAVLRRTIGRPPAEPDVLTLADLVIDVAAHRVRRGGTEVELSPTEFRLLHHLARHAGKVMSKPELLKDVWGYDHTGETTLVETYVFYLRRKIDTLGPKMIHNIRGVGYVLRVPEG